ncbi:MAG: transglycosylase SLT domain-containing protein [Nitrospira sp.]|nr:transglycosylase SLT domain-containing protein [Nitrospira sp.]
MPAIQRVPQMIRLYSLMVSLSASLLASTSDARATVDLGGLGPTSLQAVLVNNDRDEDLDSNLVPLEPELETDQAADGSDDITSPSADGSTRGTEAASPHESERSGDSIIDGTYNIPVVFDETVERHLRFFHTSIRDRFEQWLLRLSRYRPYIEAIFAEFNLPSDLIYLSLVESGFNPYAYSRAKATGPWQFIKSTGKLYGLRIDDYVDERRDPIKSTVAAARYLRDLYDLFGAWPLAMAAYNAGEGKVLRALEKVQGETFWDISNTKLLRQETKQYVPRIMAATIIAHNPERYGFPVEAGAPHQFEEVVVNRPLHFRAIAHHAGISYEELRLLNPELRRDATPPDDHAYHLKVPVGTAEKVMRVLDHIPTYKFPPLRPQVKQAKAAPPRWYRVRAGDTLEKISKRFRIPIHTLKARNNLSRSSLKVGDLLLLSR